VGVSLLVAAGVVGTLAGCGQKGGLTLPPPADSASAPAR
jgi:predicted small lipoprotein YifL